MGPKVIALLGSPLPQGNTAKLLEEAVRGATEGGCEVERIDVPALNFRACREIFFCQQEETCAMKDDITPLYQKFREIDGVILASPVMTMGIPGMLKSFMDRFQVFFMAKYMRGESLVSKEKRDNRLGLYLGISGMNVPYVFDGAKLTVQAFFHIVDVNYWDELLIRDMDTIKDISSRPELLEGAYLKGRKMCRLLQERTT
jgi:multimeric flavodoxin WrbA